MTTIYLENGGIISVYGNVLVERRGKGWIVNMMGPVAKVEPAGVMGSLSHTRAVSITLDDQPGHVLWIAPAKKKPKVLENLLIPPGVQTSWILDEEDAELVK